MLITNYGHPTGHRIDQNPVG